MWGWSVVIAILCLCYWKQKQKYKDIEKIPGPPTKYFLGNATEFGNTTAESFSACQRIIKTYGPLVRVWQGPFRVNLFITDLDHVKYFLSSNVHLKKSAGYRLFEGWIASPDGKGYVPGEKWKKHRRILTPAFHLKIIEELPSIFHSANQILVRNLKKQKGTHVDVYKYIKRYALDLFCETSMRVKIGEKENLKYLNASDVYLKIYFQRFFSVLRKSNFLFPFSSDYEAHENAVADLHNFAVSLIQQRKRERLKVRATETGDLGIGIRQKKAFLDILLDIKEFTEEEVKEEVATFLLEGHDTITAGISFGLFELAKHPDVQEKILKEIHDVVGVDNDTEMSLKALHDLKYLERTVKEILRLTPPLPVFERELTEDVVLDGLKIPSGTTISFHLYMQHRNEKFFPDPERFDPDRFLPQNTANRHPFAFIPFSAGPRNCIGSKYAMLNMKSTIAHVIRNFEIKPVSPVHVPILSSYGVLTPANGLPIILQERIGNKNEL